jgi:hypothetical protein
MVLVPGVGHILETIMILEDDHTVLGKIFWLVIVWALPFVGAFLYLIIGQRPIGRGRVMFGQAGY